MTGNIWAIISDALRTSTIVIVKSEDDLPVADGGVRKLAAVQYWIDGRVSTADILEPPSTGVCTIIGINTAGSGLDYTGTDTLFKNTAFGAGFFVNLQCSFSAPTGQVYELTGGTTGFVDMFACLYQDVDSLGVISGAGMSLVQVNIVDWGQGMVSDNNSGATFGNNTWFGGKNQLGATMITVQGSTENIQISNNFFTTAGSNEAVLDIKASSVQGSGVVVGNAVNKSLGGVVFAVGSKNYADIFWSYASNPGIENSASIVGVSTNGNTAITTTSGAFSDLNLGTALVSGVTERWQQNSAITGEVEYIGLEDQNLKITASITAVKSGGGATVTCDFRAFIDRGAGFVDLGDILDAPLQIKTTLDSKTLIVPVFVKTGDKIKILQRNNTNSDSIVVCNFSKIID